MGAVEIGEAGDRGVELQFEGAGWAVTLLTDDHFRLAFNAVAFSQPFVERSGWRVSKVACRRAHDAQSLNDSLGLESTIAQAARGKPVPNSDTRLASTSLLSSFAGG